LGATAVENLNLRPKPKTRGKKPVKDEPTTPKKTKLFLVKSINPKTSSALKRTQKKKKQPFLSGRETRCAKPTILDRQDDEGGVNFRKQKKGRPIPNGDEQKRHSTLTR